MWTKLMSLVLLLHTQHSLLTLSKKGRQRSDDIGAAISRKLFFKCT